MVEWLHQLIPKCGNDKVTSLYGSSDSTGVQTLSRARFAFLLEFYAFFLFSLLFFLFFAFYFLPPYLIFFSPFLSHPYFLASSLLSSSPHSSVRRGHLAEYLVLWQEGCSSLLSCMSISSTPTSSCLAFLLKLTPQTLQLVLGE